MCERAPERAKGARVWLTLALSFVEKQLNTTLFCRETLKYGTFCRETLKYAL